MSITPAKRITWLLLLCQMFVAGRSIAVEFTVQDKALQQCLNKLASDYQWARPQDFTEITCHGEGVASLLGLDQFKNIQTLSLYNNTLEEIAIDLSVLPHLKTLNLARNNLTHIDITDLGQLEDLYLFANRLKTLKISNLTNLKTLKANNNAITNFTYANLPKLKKIYIFNNQLETINIYDLPALQYMDCRQNPMPDSLYDEMDKVDDVIFLHDGNAEDW